jgi:hypothetical protein
MGGSFAEESAPEHGDRGGRSISMLCLEEFQILEPALNFDLKR